MSIATCPYCKMRVLAADGICPSCRKPMNAEGAVRAAAPEQAPAVGAARVPWQAPVASVSSGRARRCDACCQGRGDIETRQLNLAAAKVSPVGSITFTNLPVEFACCSECFNRERRRLWIRVLVLLGLFFGLPFAGGALMVLLERQGAPPAFGLYAFLTCLAVGWLTFPFVAIAFGAKASANLFDEHTRAAIAQVMKKKKWGPKSVPGFGPLRPGVDRVPLDQIRALVPPTATIPQASTTWAMWLGWGIAAVLLLGCCVLVIRDLLQ